MPGYTYTTQVQAKVPCGRVMIENDGLSNRKTFVISGSFKEGNSPKSGLQLADIPKSLPATSLTKQSFQANWNSVRGAEYYILEVATDKKFNNLLPAYAGIVLAQGVTSHLIENIEGENFYYRVRSGNSCLLSDFSNVINVNVSGAPPCNIGRPCDDGYDSTVNEYYDKECNCIHHECAKDSDGDGICDDLDPCPNWDNRKDLNKDGIPDKCDENTCGGKLALEVEDNSTCDYCAILSYRGRSRIEYRFEQLKELVIQTPEGDELVLNLTTNSQGFHFPYFVNAGNYYEGDCSLGQTDATIQQLVEDLQVWLTSQGYLGEVSYAISSRPCFSRNIEPEPISPNYHTLSITGTNVSFNTLKGFYCAKNKSGIAQPETSEGTFLNFCTPEVLLTALAPEDCEKPSYLWSTGETTATINISEAAETYAVTVTCIDGCEYTSDDENSCLVGSPCEGSDPCSSFYVYDENCNCTGQNPIDSDRDGVCDNLDICPGHFDFIDLDGDGLSDNDFDIDGIPDPCDDCVVGAPCDDGDFNTMNDVYLINPTVIPNQPPPPGVEYCLCQGVWNEECGGDETDFIDSDGDGVCDKLDVCQGLDDYTLPDEDGDGIPDDKDEDGIPDGCVLCEDLGVTLCPVPNESEQFCDYLLYYNGGRLIGDNGQCGLITGVEIWIQNENLIIPNPENLPNYSVLTLNAATNGFHFPYCDNRNGCEDNAIASLDDFITDLNAFIVSSPDIEGHAFKESIVEGIYANFPGEAAETKALVIENSNVSFRKIFKSCDDEGVVDSKDFTIKNCYWVVNNYHLNALIDGACQDPTYEWTFEGVPIPNTSSFVEIDNIDVIESYTVKISCFNIEEGVRWWCPYENTRCEIGAACDDGNPYTENDTMEPCCECKGTYPPIVIEEPEPCIEGESCDDGNICTINDVYIDTNCNCMGTLADSDGDMVCDEMDICEGHPDYVDTDNDGIPDGCDQTLCENTEGQPLNYIEAIRAFAACVLTTDNPGIDLNNISAYPDLNTERFIDMDDWSYFFVNEVLSNNPDLILQDDEGGTGIIETSGDETTDIDVDNLNPDSNDPNENLYSLGTEGAFDISLIMNADGNMVDDDHDGVCDLFDLDPTVANGPDNNFDGIPDNLEDNLDPFNTNIRFDLYILYHFDRECTTEVTVTPPSTGTPPIAIDPIEVLKTAMNCPPITFTAYGELDCACECIPTTNDSDGDGVPDEADQCPGANDFVDNNGNCIPDGCDEFVCDEIECPLGPCIISSVPVYNSESGICECVTLEDGDFDDDTVCDSEDQCPGSNDLADADGDNIPDGCDLCPAIPGAVGSPCNDNNECTTNETLQYSYFTVLLTDFIGADNVGALENPLDVQEVYGLFEGAGTEGYQGPPPPDNLTGLEALYAIDGDIFADVINGCECLGTEYDSDNDGVCDPLDVCEGFPDFLDYDGDGITDNDYDFDGIPDGCDPPFYEIGCPPNAPTFLTGDYTGIVLEFEGTDYPAEEIPNPVNFTFKKADGSLFIFNSVHLTIYQTLETTTSVLYEIPELDIAAIDTYEDTGETAFIGELSFSEGQYCSYLEDRKGSEEPFDPTPPFATPFACPTPDTDFYVEGGFLTISQTLAAGDNDFYNLPASITSIDLTYENSTENLVAGGNFSSNFDWQGQHLLQSNIEVPGFENEVADQIPTPLTGVSGTITFSNGMVCQYESNDDGIIVVATGDCVDENNNPVNIGDDCDDGDSTTPNDKWTAGATPEDDCECVGQVGGGGPPGGPSSATPFACPSATADFYVEGGYLTISQTPASGNIMNASTLPTAITAIDLTYDGSDENLTASGSFTTNFSWNGQFLLQSDLLVTGQETETPDLVPTPLTGVSGTITFDNGMTCEYGESGAIVTPDGCTDESGGAVYPGQACNDNNDLTHNDIWVEDAGSCACVGTLVHDADGDGVHDSEDVCPGCPDVVGDDGVVFCDCACPTPVLAVQDYGDGVPVEMIRVLSETTVNIQLVDNAEHTGGYSITWTPEGGSTEQPLLSDEREFSIDNLTRGVTYTFAIEALCGSGSWSEVLEASIYLPGNSGVCLEASTPDTEGCTEVSSLSVGDQVQIGDFQMIISDATGSNGTFSGTAYSLLPFFQAFDSDFEFTGIVVVDCDGQLVVESGSMAISQDGDIQDLVAAFMGNAVLGEGDILDDLQSALSVFSMVVDSALTVTGYENNVSGLADDIIAALPNFPFMSTALVDALQTATDCMDDVDSTIPPSSANPPVEDTYEYCQAGIQTAIDNLITYIETLYESDYQVPFYAADNQAYGFDAQDYQIHNDLYDQIDAIATEPYSVAWKSVKTGTEQTDIVNAITSIPDVIYFQDDKQDDIDIVNPPPLSAGNQQIEVNGLSEPGMIKEIFAIQPVAEDAHDHSDPADGGDPAHIHIAGKLNVISYDEKPLNVQLVNVNSTSTTLESSDLAIYLNNVYKQAVVEVTVNPDIIDIQVPEEDFDGVLDEISTGFLSRYIEEEKEIIRYFKNNVADHPVQNTYYVFLVEDAVQDGLEGHMPKAKGFGFVVAGHHSDNTDLSRTIAHELGHGAFTLEHPHEEYGDNPELNHPTDSPNLMDYGSGALLRKYQWDKIHNPGVHLGIFDEDSESLSVANTEVDFNDFFIAVRAANTFVNDCNQNCHSSGDTSGNPDCPDCEEFINYKVQYCHQGDVLPEGIDVVEKGKDVTNPYDWTYLTSEESCGPIDYFFDGEREGERDNEIYIFRTYNTYSPMFPQYYEGGWKNYYVKLKIIEEDGSITDKDFGQITSTNPLSKFRLKGVPKESNYYFKLEEKNYDFDEEGRKENIQYFSGIIKVSLGLSKDNENWEFSEKYHEINMMPSEDIVNTPQDPEPDEEILCTDITLYYNVNSTEAPFPENGILEIESVTDVVDLYLKKSDDTILEMNGNEGKIIKTDAKDPVTGIAYNLQEYPEKATISLSDNLRPGTKIYFTYATKDHVCEIGKEIYVTPQTGYFYGNNENPTATTAIPSNSRLKNALNRIKEVNPAMHDYLENNVQVNFNKEYSTGSSNEHSANALLNPNVSNELILKEHDGSLGIVMNGDGCPTGVEKYYGIISKQDQMTILAAIDEVSVAVTPEITAIIDKLNERDPIMGNNLTNWVSVTDGQGVRNARNEYSNEYVKLIYEIALSEAESRVQWYDFGVISYNEQKLATNLSIIAANSTILPFSGVLDKESWLANHSGEYEQTIQRIYNRVIAHELAHLYYKHQQNKLLGYVWHYIEANMNIDNSCYPANDNTYCTDTPGHSDGNPDGVNACNEEHSSGYEQPYIPPEE